MARPAKAHGFLNWQAEVLFEIEQNTLFKTRYDDSNDKTLSIFSIENAFSSGHIQLFRCALCKVRWNTVLSSYCISARNTLAFSIHVWYSPSSGAVFAAWTTKSRHAVKGAIPSSFL